MNEQERREQTEAMLKLLDLNQEYIKKGNFTDIETFFAEIEAMDKSEFGDGGSLQT
ncbi:hypothetical protein PQR14_23345 [Paraburkholderia bryophila]|uniref:hypothetical protein n=1 Tax=Burkholderiaceae TaxID=119060 RepID=UPI0018CE6F51|nr:hypothetical protein [Burkholderia sp. 9120]